MVPGTTSVTLESCGGASPGGPWSMPAVHGLAGAQLPVKQAGSRHHPAGLARQRQSKSDGLAQSRLAWNADMFSVKRFSQGPGQGSRDRDCLRHWDLGVKKCCSVHPGQAAWGSRDASVPRNLTPPGPLTPVPIIILWTGT